MKVLKTLALRYLPYPILSRIKRIRYAHAFAAARLQDDPEVEVISRLLRPGDCVVDVGAHIGIYSKLFSQLVGPAGQVVAIEPVPATFQILEANLRRHALANVKALNYAISDRPGTLTMEVPRTVDGADGSYFARVMEKFSGPGALAIEGYTLDSLFADHDRAIRCIKVDVEGHELACIRGAQRTLERFRPLLLIEVLSDPDQAGSPAQELFELLDKCAYAPYRLEGTRLVPRLPRTPGLNYFWLQESDQRKLGISDG